MLIRDIMKLHEDPPSERSHWKTGGLSLWISLKPAVRVIDKNKRKVAPNSIASSTNLACKKGRWRIPQAVFRDFLMTFKTELLPHSNPIVAVTPITPRALTTPRIVLVMNSPDTGKKLPIISITWASSSGDRNMKPVIEIIAKIKGKSESKR